MAHDLICATNHHKFEMAQNTWKRCCWHSNIWPDWFTSHKSHYYQVTMAFTIWFMRKYSVLTLKYLKQYKIVEIFNILGKSSLQKWRNGNLCWLSGTFHTVILRPGDTSQNLEFLILSGRVGINDILFFEVKIMFLSCVL